MECEGFPAESYALFALGNLTGPEWQEIQNHLLQRCERCRGELRESRNTWYNVAAVTPIQEPRRALRTRVLRMIADTQSESRRGVVWGWRQAFGGLALAIATLLVGWYAGHQEQAPLIVSAPPLPTRSPAVSALEAENARLRTELARAEKPAPPSVVAPLPAVRPGGREPEELTRLERDLTEARQAVTRLQTNLNQQNAALANAAREVEEANRRAALAAAPNGNSALQAAQTQLASAAQRVQSLERQITEYQFLLAQERRRSAGSLRIASLLENPGLKLVRLRSTEQGAASEGNALISAGSQVVFYGFRLPRLSAGRTYQLWLIRDRNPAIVSAGVFAPDAQSRAVVDFRGAALTSNITALAVTDEPAGGSQTPTGNKVLIGS